MKRLTIAIGLAAVLALATAAPAFAAPGFGAHVSACAKGTGFSGTMNPSMCRPGAGDCAGM